MNIFEIERSKRDADFIKQNGELELEVAADIIETCKDVPYVDSLIKLGKVFITIKDWWFTKKLAKFLTASEDIEEETKNQFYSSLSQEDYKRISAYLIHLLSTAEEEDKATIMGSIYKARLMKRINNNEMLRLCSIVTRAFLPDLKRLPDYLEDNTDISLEAQSFINLGLIDNFIGGVWKDGVSCCLNDTGKLLHDILSESGWFCKHSI